MSQSELYLRSEKLRSEKQRQDFLGHHKPTSFAFTLCHLCSSLLLQAWKNSHVGILFVESWAFLRVDLRWQSQRVHHAEQEKVSWSPTGKSFSHFKDTPSSMIVSDVYLGFQFVTESDSQFARSQKKMPSPKREALKHFCFVLRLVFDNHIGLTGNFHRQIGDMLHSFEFRDSQVTRVILLGMLSN